MCWNQYVSLNTYLFSMGMLCLMIYNNNYSPYKVNINVYGYFFIISFCSMQLIEYFLWKNLENKELNYFYSALGQLLVTVQPIASLLLLSNHILKMVMILLYSIFVITIFFTHKKVFKTTSQNGHLKWTWVPIHYYLYFIWMFFLMFSFIVNHHYTAIGVALFLFAITYLTSTSGTSGSLWCWTINFSMIFYALYLLLYMPFKELNGC
jgi:hypothetical protein